MPDCPAEAREVFFFWAASIKLSDTVEEGDISLSLYLLLQ